MYLTDNERQVAGRLLGKLQVPVRDDILESVTKQMRSLPDAEALTNPAFQVDDSQWNQQLCDLFSPRLMPMALWSHRLSRLGCDCRMPRGQQI